MVTPSCRKNNIEDAQLTSIESTLKNYDQFLDHSIILSTTLHLPAYYPRTTKSDKTVQSFSIVT